MRDFKMFFLGALLCWTVVCSGTEAWGESEDNFFPSDFKDNFDIDDVLKLDGLFRADNPTSCEGGGTDICKKLNKVCNDKEGDDSTYECGECIQDFSKKGGSEDCTQNICAEGGDAICENVNKICTDVQGESTSECGACKPGFSTRDEKDECIQETCAKGGKLNCDNLNKICLDAGETSECKECKEGFVEKDGSKKCFLQKACKEGGEVICENLNKTCTEGESSSECGDCKTGFLKKDGTHDCIKNNCKNFGTTACGISKKLCVDEGDGYKCEGCIDGFEKKEESDECIQNNCENFGTALCATSHKLCTDKTGGYDCGECSEGFAKKDGSNDCIANNCENFGTAICANSRQLCQDKTGGYDCGECIVGFYKKDGASVCIQKPCAEGGTAICEKLNKTCTDNDGSSECKDCKAGFSKKDGTNDCIKNNCKNFGTTICGNAHKICEDKGDKYECGKCNDGFEIKDGSDECIENSCHNFGYAYCFKFHKNCSDKTGGYDCGECIKGFAIKDGSNDCINKTCENFGTADCDKLHKTCNDAKEGYKCGPCKDAFVKKDGTEECVPKTCGNFGNGFCDNLHKQCVDKQPEGYECGSCKDGFVKKEGTNECVKKTCENAGNKECDALHKICESKDDGSYACGNCKGGYAKKPGGDTCLKESCDVENNKCKYNGTCVNKLCDCLSGFSGDLCEKIYECEEGEFKLCKGDKGKCDFNDAKGNVDCQCGDKTYDKELKYCRSNCTKSEECKNGKCENGVCKCDKGYVGDDCSKIDGCDELKDKCEKTGAKCELNTGTSKGHCVCTDLNYIYQDDKCKAKWCEPNPCKSGAECKFENGIGTCKCADNKYYDYKMDLCKAIDPCLNKSCGKNKKCNSADGNCVCIRGFKPDGDDCKPNACDGDPCFGGAECSETDKPNVVKCTCKESEIFKQSKCNEATCFLMSQNCTSCPSGMKLDNGVCKHEEGKECTTDCGYGWCIKNGDKEECKCRDERFTKSASGKCVLNEAACASRKIDTANPNKCNCTTDSKMYKLASNGITCERKSCADEDVQDECKKKNAQCQNTWKDSTKSYDCACADGYVKDSQTGVCTDPCSNQEAKSKCSINKQTCFLSNLKGRADCRCSPAFTLNSQNKRCEPSEKGVDYMLLNLPVESGQYMKDGSVDYVKLSKDVIDAMEESFKSQEIEFAALYKYKLGSDNIILCDVWLQFKPDATKIVDRWDKQKIIDDKVTFLPPALRLSSTKVNDVKSDKMTFCSDAVKAAHCGKNIQCDNKKCSCRSGFKVIESTRLHYGDYETLHCEDIDECEEGLHKCSENTMCSNTPGDYYCKCKDGFKKEEGPPNAETKGPCIDLCSPNICGKGKCEKKNNTVDCTCDPGYGGSFCNREDANFKRASKNTVVVGAVLGTILGVIVILFVFYVVRQRKNSYSEDFTPAPRLDNAEMVERRPMRGVTNRAYQ